MKNKAIFIGATGQNVGKTTLCLGILSGLQKRYSSVGFIKPVGQQHVKISDTLKVDKDVMLFKDHFNLKTNWEDMSPLIIPSGFTREFLDGQVNQKSMESKILNSFKKISQENSVVVVEGTGHVGVGSIVNLNNAQVAAILQTDMIIIASGGLGSAHDELAINVAMCHEYGVKIRGVLLNRVLDDKRDMILEYFPKSLAKWNIPLIGCVPYNEFLSMPCMKDFELLLEAPLISGEQYRLRHFKHIRLVASSLQAYRNNMTMNELIITPASREDIIIETLEHHVETLENDGIDFGGGMILTSKEPPSQYIINKIKQANIPVLYAPICSYDATKMITSFIAKIRKEDVRKIEQAINLVESNVNFDLLDL
jgi:BioD-like phosphotransacetylase family protein